MANNPYVNKVIYGNSTIMDISDTTAGAADVESGKVFYTASGARTVGTSLKTHYATCDTAAATVQKEATISGIDELYVGLQVVIKFTYSNTATSPTFKLNTLDAKPMYRYGTTVPGTSAASTWNADSVVTLTYDGVGWYLTDHLNTTYSSMTVAEYQAGTGTTARSITPARLKGAIQYHAIPLPSSASSGDFLVYNGTAWVAQTLSTWQGGSY